MPRLPVPGSDSGAWGQILNSFLSQSLNNDGSLRNNVITADKIQQAAITDDKIASISQSKVIGLATALQAKADASTAVTGAGGITSLWKGTQEDYDMLTVHDDMTLYIIVDDGHMEM